MKCTADFHIKHLIPWKPWIQSLWMWFLVFVGWLQIQMHIKLCLTVAQWERRAELRLTVITNTQGCSLNAVLFTVNQCVQCVSCEPVLTHVCLCVCEQKVNEYGSSKTGRLLWPGITQMRWWPEAATVLLMTDWPSRPHTAAGCSTAPCWEDRVITGGQLCGCMSSAGWSSGSAGCSSLKIN